MAEVFISHSSKDAAVAQALCGILEQNGISCWMAPRNIMPGEDWATAIAKAITTTRVFLIIYSGNSAASTEVPKEIMLAGSKRSYIIPYKIDDTPLRENFEYHLGASHWISADISKGNYKAEELLAAVRSGMGNAAPVTNVAIVNNNNSNIAVNIPAPVQKKNNKLVPIIIAAAAVLLIGIGALVAIAVGNSEDDRGKPDKSYETVETSEYEDRDDDSDKENSKDDSEDEQKPQGVIELYPYDSSHVTEYKGRSDKFVIFGEEYNEGYVFEQADGWMMLNVSDCSEFTFTAGRIDGTPDKEREIYVYLDGIEHDHYTITPNSADKITVPLNGTKIMRIESRGNGSLPALGLYDVQFKGNAAQADSAETEEIQTSGTTGLVELTAYDSSHTDRYDGRHEEFLVFGEVHNEGYLLNQSDAWLMFNVKSCDEVTFTAGRIDGTPDKDREIYVYLDGVEYDYYKITPSATETITIPLGDANIMRIYSPGNGTFPELGLYNMRFSGTAPQQEEHLTLKTEAYETGHATLCNDRHTTFNIFGEVHNNGYKMNQSDSWLLFNANGYTEFSFTAGRIDGTPSKNREIHIYLDGIEYDYFTITPEAVESITVPLNGTKVVRVYSPANGTYPELGIYDISFSGEYAPVYPENIGSTIPDSYELTHAEEYDNSHDSIRILGENHNNGYKLNQSDSRIMLNVYGYTEISFTAARLDGANRKEREIMVYLDGKQYDYFTLTPDMPEDITIPINGAKTMQIFSAANGTYPEVGLFNFRLTGEKQPLKPVQATGAAYALTDIPVYASEAVNSMNGTEFLVCGESHESGFVSEQRGTFSLSFNVSGYTECVFTAARVDGSYFNPRRITIYLDGIEAQSYDIGPDSAPLQITVPLNGAGVIDIRGEEGNHNSPCIGFYDVHFKK